MAVSSNQPKIQANTTRASFVSIFILCQLIAANFLFLDGLKRLSDPLRMTPLPSLLINFVVVASAATVFSLLLSLVLWGVEKLRAGLSGPLLFFLFYTITVSFAKFRFVPEIDFIPYRTRWIACILALALCIPVGLLARNSLRALRDFSARQNKRAVLLLSLPFIIATILAGTIRVLTFEQDPPAQAKKPYPNILFLTLDGFALTDMSLYGYERPTTPELEKWAPQFAVFSGAHATSNATDTAISSFLGHPFGAAPKSGRLTDKLADLGYQDRLWISTKAANFFHVEGFNQEIVFYAFEQSKLYKALNQVFPRSDLIWLSSLATEEWYYFWPYQVDGTAEYHKMWAREHHPADLGLDLTKDYLKKPRETPAFAWLHLHQPHYPYLPLAPYKGRFGSSEVPYPPLTGSVYTPGYQDEVTLLRRRYDEYVLQLDKQLGDFLQELESEGLLETTVILISADHGESFEAGFVGHGGESLGEPELRIPFLLHVPGLKSKEQIQTFCSPLDIAPTLLSYLRAEEKARSYPGENLLPYIQNPSQRSQKPRLSVSYQAFTRSVGEVAVYSGKHKVVFRKEDRNKVKVFDLQKDPGAATDVFESFADQARNVAQSLKW